MPDKSKKKAKLMIWKDAKTAVWKLTLWIPFHGQWLLTENYRKPAFERKANQMIKAFPGIEVERVDSATNENTPAKFKFQL